MKRVVTQSLIFGALLVAPSLSAFAAQPHGRMLALLVGNDDYVDPQWADLRYARKDASDLAAVFSESFHKTILLVGEPVTRTRFLAGMDTQVRD